MSFKAYKTKCGFKEPKLDRFNWRKASQQISDYLARKGADEANRHNSRLVVTPIKRQQHA